MGQSEFSPATPADVEEPLREGATVVFQNERRTQDKAWTIAAVCCLVATLVVGLYASMNSASDASLKNTPSHLAKPQSCRVTGRRLQESLNHQGDSAGSSSMFLEVTIGIALSTAGSFGVGILYIVLFKRIPHLMVHGTFCIYVSLIAISGLAYVASSFAASNGDAYVGVALLIVAGVCAGIYYVWRNEIALCSRLLGVSAVGLKCNPCLVLFVLVVNVVAIHALQGIAALIGMAIMNNGQVVSSGAHQVGDVCYTGGEITPCCVWQASGWAWGYSIFAVGMMFWVFFFARQLSTFVVSGAIAQWYYTPLSRANSTKGYTKRSIKHAFGTGLGTVCCGGAILFAIEWIRFFMYSIVFLRIFANLFHSVTSHLTKFAVVMASISGEDFVSAGKKSTNLLIRNCLKSFGVWWIPSFVMKISALLVACMWAFVVLGIQEAIALVSGNYAKEGTLVSWYVAAASFWISFLVLWFFGSILLSIVDATYLCYAIDRDTQTITKQEVHDVFAQVPIGAAVEQPDGELQYGNPYNYVPPSDPDAAQPLQNNAIRV